MSGKDLVKERVRMALQVVLVEELPMEFWRKSRTKCVLRDSRCTKPYVFPYKVRPRTSMIYLCGATVARRSRVWSDHGRIMLGSVPHCKWGFTCFSCMCGRQNSLWFATVGSFPQCKWDCKWCWWMSCRWNSIVLCNCRIVPAMQMALQVVLVEELPMEFWRKSRTKCFFER